MRMNVGRSTRVLSAWLLAASLGTASAQDIRVTLLGTGTPAPVMNRFGPSILVEAGEQKFLFDAGRGAMQRLTQIRVGWKDVTGVFLTHLHSDHVVGFPDLWLTGWLFGERAVPLRVWGPRGTHGDAAWRSRRGHCAAAPSPALRPPASASADGAGRTRRSPMRAGRRRSATSRGAVGSPRVRPT